MNKDYFWIVAVIEGQPYLVYGGETRDEAIRNALETNAPSNFKLYKFPTRDRSSASAYLKGKRLGETHDWKQATRRVKHTMRRKTKTHRRR